MFSYTTRDAKAPFVSCMRVIFVLLSRLFAKWLQRSFASWHLTIFYFDVVVFFYSSPKGFNTLILTNNRVSQNILHNSHVVAHLQKNYILEFEKAFFQKLKYLKILYNSLTVLVRKNECECFIFVDQLKRNLIIIIVISIGWDFYHHLNHQTYWKRILCLSQYCQ